MDPTRHVSFVIKKSKIFCFILFFLFFSSLYAEDPAAIYLSFVEDPSTSMTVQWHTEVKEKDSLVWYRKESDQEWLQKEGSFLKPEKYDVLIHRVDLSALEPYTVYQFRLGTHKKILKFRTLPKELEEPVQFVIGGDVYKFFTLFKQMNQQIAKKNPDFIVVGGDIAYTFHNRTYFKGKDWEMKRWTTFFTEWRKSMVTSDGRMIPIVPVVGNHDVPRGLIDPRKTPVLFYQLFAIPNDISYRTLDIGSYLTLFLLDTNHSYPIEGVQTDWLQKALQNKSSMPFKISIYHIGAFPSVYPYNGTIPGIIRKNWCPLFEEYGVQLAFENHSHAFKRTYPIKQEKVDPNGVIYIGDGCWGVMPRKPKSRAWYLERKEKKNCFTMLTLTKDGCELKSYNNKGKLIDAAPKIAPTHTP